MIPQNDNKSLALRNQSDEMMTVVGLELESLLMVTHELPKLSRHMKSRTLVVESSNLEVKGAKLTDLSKA